MEFVSWPFNQIKENLMKVTVALWDCCVVEQWALDGLPNFAGFPFARLLENSFLLCFVWLKFQRGVRQSAQESRRSWAKIVFLMANVIVENKRAVAIVLWCCWLDGEWSKRVRCDLNFHYIHAITLAFKTSSERHQNSITVSAKAQEVAFCNTSILPDLHINQFVLLATKYSYTSCLS